MITIGQKVWLKEVVRIGERSYTLYQPELVERVSRDGNEFESNGRRFSRNGQEMVDRSNANGGRWLHHPTCFFEQPEVSHSFGHIYNLNELYEMLEDLFSSENDCKTNESLIKSIKKSVKSHAKKHNIEL